MMSTSDGWPVKPMSSDYPVYKWPYGARALIAERAKVEKVVLMRMQMISGWRHGHHDNVFMVPLTFKEAFVRNDTERITLTDRVRTHHNFEWKRDTHQHAHARVSDGGMRPADRHYAMLVNNLLEMQALTEELKTETLELIWACGNSYELEQAMLNARF